MIHYGVTKTAQIAWASGLAELTAAPAITVNSVLPADSIRGRRGVRRQAVRRKSFEEFEKEFFEKVRPNSLIKRFASVEEVASLGRLCPPVRWPPHHRRGFARGGRRGEIRLLTRFLTRMRHFQCS